MNDIDIQTLRSKTAIYINESDVKFTNYADVQHINGADVQYIYDTDV